MSVESILDFEGEFVACAGGVGARRIGHRDVEDEVGGGIVCGGDDVGAREDDAVCGACADFCFGFGGAVEAFTFIVGEAARVDEGREGGVRGKSCEWRGEKCRGEEEEVRNIFHVEVPLLISCRSWSRYRA